MRNLALIFLLFMLFSAIPKIFNYQGKIVDTSGVGVNDTLEIIFRLYKESTGGMPLWEESHSNVVVRNGLFSLLLGDIVEFPESVDFSEQYWLEVEIEGEILTPRERLVSVPYSLFSLRGGADNDWQIVDSNMYAIPAGGVAIGTTEPLAKMHIKTGDTITSPMRIDALTQRALSGWQYRVPISLNNPGAQLEDYQILITLNTAELISEGKLRPDCADLRFTSGNGLTYLPYWIESGCNTESTRVWVRIPLIPSGTSGLIYAYYGNSSATSASSAAETFVRVIDGGSPLRASWNFDENSGSVAHDLSGNNNHGSLRPSDSPPSWQPGRFNSALSFGGANKYVFVPHSSTLNLSSEVTLEAWVNDPPPKKSLILDLKQEDPKRAFKLHPTIDGKNLVLRTDTGTEVKLMLKKVKINEIEYRPNELDIELLLDKSDTAPHRYAEYYDIFNFNYIINDTENEGNVTLIFEIEANDAIKYLSPYDWSIGVNNLVLFFGDLKDKGFNLNSQKFGAIGEKAVSFEITGIKRKGENFSLDPKVYLENAADMNAVFDASRNKWFWFVNYGGHSATVKLKYSTSFFGPLTEIRSANAFYYTGTTFIDASGGVHWLVTKQGGCVVYQPTYDHYCFTGSCITSGEYSSRVAYQSECCQARKFFKYGTQIWIPTNYQPGTGYDREPPAIVIYDRTSDSWTPWVLEALNARYLADWNSWKIFDNKLYGVWVGATTRIYVVDIPTRMVEDIDVAISDAGRWGTFVDVAGVKYFIYVGGDNMLYKMRYSGGSWINEGLLGNQVSGRIYNQPYCINSGFCYVLTSEGYSDNTKKLMGFSFDGSNMINKRDVILPDAADGTGIRDYNIRTGDELGTGLCVAYIIEQDVGGKIYAYTEDLETPTIVGKGKNAYQLSISGTTVIGYINNNQVSATIDKTWRHVILTYDGSKIRLFIDGVLRDSLSFSGTINTNSDSLIIGKLVNGLIDEVRVYGKALTSEEIQDLYANYGYVSLAYPGRVFVRRFSASEPIYSFGTEQLNTPRLEPVFYIQHKTGNVGLGTVTPASRLHIVDGSIAITSPGEGIILRAFDGENCYRLTVDNTGTITVTPITCPE